MSMSFQPFYLQQSLYLATILQVVPVSIVSELELCIKDTFPKESVFLCCTMH
jgi:hypothetical protein